MTSTRIEFASDGAVLHLGQTVSGLAGEIQHLLINLGTDSESDPVFPGRGTNLLQEAVQGGIVDLNSARHAANIAALLALTFYNTVTPASVDQDTVTDLALSADEFDGKRLILKTSVVAKDGREVGDSNTLAL